MATRQKRVSRTTVKKETSVEDSEMLDQQDLDDALERAENLLEQKEQKVKSSPIKKVSTNTLLHQVSRQESPLLTNL